MISADKRQDKLQDKLSGHELSRRTLLTGGLAAGFVLAFHLPLRKLLAGYLDPGPLARGPVALGAQERLPDRGLVQVLPVRSSDPLQPGDLLH